MTAIEEDDTRQLRQELLETLNRLSTWSLADAKFADPRRGWSTNK